MLLLRSVLGVFRRPSESEGRRAVFCKAAHHSGLLPRREEVKEPCLPRSDPSGGFLILFRSLSPAQVQDPRGLTQLRRVRPEWEHLHRRTAQAQQLPLPWVTPPPPPPRQGCLSDPGAASHPHGALRELRLAKGSLFCGPAFSGCSFPPGAQSWGGRSFCCRL